MATDPKKKKIDTRGKEEEVPVVNPITDKPRTPMLGSGGSKLPGIKADLEKSMKKRSSK